MVAAGGSGCVQEGAEAVTRYQLRRRRNPLDTTAGLLTAAIVIALLLTVPLLLVAHLWLGPLHAFMPTGGP